VRTVIAPLAPEVEAQIDALGGTLGGIARRYIRRLALEPLLGSPVNRGRLASTRARRIRFDRDDRPEDLLRSRRVASRRGDQDLCEGPQYRIVYLAREAPGAGVRLIVILAVGKGHARPPDRDAYQLAETHVHRLRIERSDR
jgi:hypothetical protein